MARRFGRLAGWLLGALVSVMMASEAGAAQCSLAWPELQRNFGDGAKWALAAPPVLVFSQEDQKPAYQAQVFESSQGDRMALVIAEFGDPRSPDLGAVVYCTVRNPQGEAVEETGTNPLESAKPAA
jgi:hypothetical protein